MLLERNFRHFLYYISGVFPRIVERFGGLDIAINNAGIGGNLDRQATYDINLVRTNLSLIHFVNVKIVMMIEHF